MNNDCPAIQFHTMLGYSEGGKKQEEITTCSSVISSSVTSKNGSLKPVLVPVHDLIQEELERRAVKILSNSRAKLPIHLVSTYFFYFIFTTHKSIQITELLCG